MKYNILNVKGHDIKIKIYRNKYYGYSEKRLKKRYPDGNYNVVGEFKKGSDKNKIGELSTGDTVSKLDTHSRVANRKKGYLCVGKDTFILVLSPRAILPFIFIIIGLFIAFMLFLPTLQTVIKPEEKLDDVTPIINDQSVKPDKEDGDGSVTMIWTLDATADLSEGKVSVYFKNPNASTHDVEVELYIISQDEEILIARSERVYTGYALNYMDILNSVKLEEGIYKGFYRVIGYDPKTGEEAAYLPQISDVVVTAKY